jgi:hypothetical protein
MKNEIHATNFRKKKKPPQTKKIQHSTQSKAQHLAQL